jgi:hypothetical protein
MAFHYPLVLMCHLGVCNVFGPPDGPSPDRATCEARSREAAVWAYSTPGFDAMVASGMAHFTGCVSLARPFDPDYHVQTVLDLLTTGVRPKECVGFMQFSPHSECGVTPARRVP